MASKEAFEDHCWKDVISADDIKLYSPYARETFVGPSTDIIIYKQRASVFQGTPFLSHLNLLGIRGLLVCGESTSGCVRASAVDAYRTGFMCRSSRNARSTVRN
jgi:nicotinamidase-related amidase